MNKRTFLMLSQVFESGRVRSSEYPLYRVSEKLDGVRAYWDGGVSRGIPAAMVPYANTEKDARLLKGVIASGLWTRYGKVIHAPNAWLDQLPKDVPLDGELFVDRGQFQRTVSITKCHTPIMSEWESVKFMVFDTPSYEIFSYKGVVNETHHKARFDDNVREWFKSQGAVSPLGPMPDFLKVCSFLSDRFPTCDSFDLTDSDGVVRAIRQIPGDQWEDYYGRVIESGGEGVMFRAGWSNWTPSRSWDLMKMKPSTAGECKVIGWRSGRLTDKGSKLLGLMGSLRVSWDGQEFLLSGFNDNERRLVGDAVEWAVANPDCDHPTGEGLMYFELGDVIPFRYSELSVEGVPLKASYLRG